MASEVALRKLITAVELRADVKKGIKQLKRSETVLAKHLEKVKKARKAHNSFVRALGKNEKNAGKQVLRELEVAEKERARARIVLAKKERAKRIRQLDKRIRDLKRFLAKADVMDRRRADREHKRRLRANRKARRARMKRIKEIQRGILIEERAELKSLRRRVAAQKRAAKERARAMRRVTGLRASIFGALPAGVGTGLGIWFVYDRILKGAADAADQAAVVADQIGQTAENVQRLRHVSAIVGTKFGEVKTALRRMADNAEDAGHGAGMAVRAFRELGIHVRDPRLQDNMELLREIFVQMDKIPKALRGRKIQGLSAQIFGRAGAKSMGPLLEQGAAGFQKLMQEADELGLVLSKKLTRASQKFNDEIIRMWGVLRGIRNMMAEEMLPVITQILEAMTAWFRANRKIIRSGLDWWIKLIFKIAGAGLKVFERVDRIVNQFSDWGKVTGVLVGVMTALLTALGALAAILLTGAVAANWGKIVTLFAAFGKIVKLAALPLLRFVALAAVLALVFDDFFTFLRGGNSLMERILLWFFDLALGAQQAQSAVDGLRDVWNAIGRLASAILASTWQLIKSWIDNVVGAVGGVLKFIQGAASSFGLNLNLDPGALLSGAAGQLDQFTSVVLKGGAPSAGGASSTTNQQNNTFVGVTPQQASDISARAARFVFRGQLAPQ